MIDQFHKTVKLLQCLHPYKDTILRDPIDHMSVRPYCPIEGGVVQQKVLLCPL